MSYFCNMAFRNDIDNLDKFLRFIQMVQNSLSFASWYQTNKDHIEYEIKYLKIANQNMEIKLHEIHDIYQRCYRYEQLLEELDLLNALDISSRSKSDVQKPQCIQLNIGKSIYYDQSTMEQVKIYSERLAEKLNLHIK